MQGSGDKNAKLGTCVIRLFREILTEKSNYSIILVIQGHLLDGSNRFFCAEFKSDKCQLEKFCNFL